MWWIGRVLQRRQDSISPAELTGIPAVCYSGCSETYTIAQITGKTPALCETGSDFTTSLSACESCVDANNASDTTYIQDSFAEFIDFCVATTDSSSSSSAIPATFLTWYGSYTLSPVLQLPSSPGAPTSTLTIVSAFVNVTSTLPAWYFHLSVSSLVNTYFQSSFFTQLAADVASAASVASVTGDPTSLVYQALEATSVPPWFVAGVPSTYSSELYTLESEINELRATPVSIESPTLSTTTTTTPPSSTTPSSHPTSANKSWIAGPVIGALIAISLLFWGIFVYIRRHKRSTGASERRQGHGQPETEDKPQLHSEHLPPRQLYELDAAENRSEMRVNERLYPEMAANEVAAQEMRG